MDLNDPHLGLAADVVDDLENVRKATANRLLIMTRTEVDKDGQVRGFGLPDTHPDVVRLRVQLDKLIDLEKTAVRDLEKRMRAHPLGPWMKAQRGVGDKQGARLLAAIRDPYVNDATGRPRTVSALWAYCGLHTLPIGDGTDIAAKRRRGERANWSGTAKMRTHLIAESCIKTIRQPCSAVGGHVSDECRCSPYRLAYDDRRAHTAVTRPGWTDGHSHNDGLRVAGKAFLRDLWRAARALHHTADAAP